MQKIFHFMFYTEMLTLTIDLCIILHISFIRKDCKSTFTSIKFQFTKSNSTLGSYGQFCYNTVEIQFCLC